MNRSGTRWWFGAHSGEVKRAWGPSGTGGRGRSRELGISRLTRDE